MKKYIILFLLFSVLFTSKIYSQRYPFSIMPKDSILVLSKTDTLWVLKHKQLLKTIEVAKINKLRGTEVELMKEQITVLKTQVDKQKILIDTLKSDRNYYKEIWEDCNKDVKKQSKRSLRQKKMTRIVTIAGIATTIVAFFAGGYFIRI